MWVKVSEIGEVCVKLSCLHRIRVMRRFVRRAVQDFLYERGKCGILK